jgi:hypothetical protein
MAVTAQRRRWQERVGSNLWTSFRRPSTVNVVYPTS